MSGPDTRPRALGSAHIKALHEEEAERDEALRGDLDVNYGLQENAAPSLIKWFAGAAATVFLGSIGSIVYMFIYSGSITDEAANRENLLLQENARQIAEIQKAASEERRLLAEQLSEQFTNIRERLSAIETKQRIGCEPYERSQGP